MRKNWATERPRTRKKKEFAVKTPDPIPFVIPETGADTSFHLLQVDPLSSRLKDSQAPTDIESACTPPVPPRVVSSNQGCPLLFTDVLNNDHVPNSDLGPDETVLLLRKKKTASQGAARKGRRRRCRIFRGLFVLAGRVGGTLMGDSVVVSTGLCSPRDS